MHDRPERSEPSSAQARSSRQWARAGVVSAGLWFVVTVAVVLWNGQSGNPRLSSGVTFAAGPLALLTIGWIYRLRGPGQWSRAAILTIGIYAAVCFLALVLLIIVSWHPA